MKPSEENSELLRIGWDADWQANWQTCLRELSGSQQHENHNYVAARVIGSSVNPYQLLGPDGARPGRLSGHLLRGSTLPVTGDWLLCEISNVAPETDPLLIQAILPRRTYLARKSAGSNQMQMLAANIDLAMILMGLDENFNLRRLERFLVTAHEGGVQATIVLTKKDLLSADECLARLREVQDIVDGRPVICIDNISGEGVLEVLQLIQPGLTYALLGSSGAGKSSLTNRLLGQEVQAINTVRKSDHKGRHTTTSRDLITLPGGGILMDTPGLKEIQPIQAAESIDAIFSEISELAENCRFRDCTHQSEPGCAVLAALQNGGLSEERWLAYQKMTREDARLNAQLDGLALQEQRHKDRKQGQLYKSIVKEKNRRRGR